MEPAKEPEPEWTTGSSRAQAAEDDSAAMERSYDLEPQAIKKHTPEPVKDPLALHDGLDVAGCEGLCKQGEACADEPTNATSETATSGQTTRQPRHQGWRSLRQRFVKGKGRLAAAASGGVSSGAVREDSEMLVGDEASHAQEGADEANAASDACESAAKSWLVVDREGVVVAEEDGDLFSKDSVEAKIEMLLTWMLAPAVHGIPKLGVPSAADRAGELLGNHDRDVEAAVREVVAGSEKTVPLLVLNFCLERIPVLGCPVVLLRATWGNLRSVLIIAALYGHDLESPRVLHESLLCLVPPSEDDKAEQDSASAKRSWWTSRGGQEPWLVGDTAQRVARMMIRGAIKRATGLRAAVDCFELASLLYSSGTGICSADDDGFVHVMATPASAARDFFRRRSFASCALLWGSLPVLALGMAAPGLFVVIRWMSAVVGAFRSLESRVLPSCAEVLPAAVLASLGSGFAVRAVFRRLQDGRSPGRRHLRRFTTTVRTLRVVQTLRAKQEAWPQLVSTMVFTLHALLPAFSTFSAVSVILNTVFPAGEDSLMGVSGWDLLHRLSCLALGIYSLSSIMVHLQGPELSEITEPRPRVICIALRAASRCIRVTLAIMRGCCILAAWAYVSLALDLGASHMLCSVGWSKASGGTALGVVEPLSWLLSADPAESPLRSERAFAFILNLVAVVSQQRLVELLGRREVLLRLIGAEHVTASTLCLLLKGVAVACINAKNGHNPIAEFLARVSPPPVCCVVVVALRGQALVMGVTFGLAPRLIASGALGGNTSSFILGLLAGAYAAHSLLYAWYSNRADFDSPALRLTLLVPGSVSGRAKGVMREALYGARTRAVQMMAMGILERIVRWWFGPKPP